MAVNSGYKQQLDAQERKKKAERTGTGKKKKKGLLGTGFLNRITPRKGYRFHSDYFEIDNSVATIVTVFNKQGSDDNLAGMWGINLIPRNLGENVSTRLITQINQAEQKWVDAKQSKADDLSSAEAGEASRSNRTKDNIMASKKRRDLNQIAEDLAAGDSYLFVAFKIFIKAPTLEELDTAIDRLKRAYDTTFGAVYVARFEGRQYDDLSNLLHGGEAQLGNNYMFTSSEFAGSYNLVTHGIEDVRGTYVGVMREDVNHAAVLWDMDDFESHAIIASDNRPVTLSYQQGEYNRHRSSTLWGARVSQTALMNNHRVVHLVLNGAKLEDVGVDLSMDTANVSMENGDINMFELFGDAHDELNVFAKHVEKIVLMVKQLNKSLTQIAIGILQSELADFYINQGMWIEDAMNNRDKLRLVNIPHKDVPLLQKFSMYLDTRYSSYVSRKGVDPNVSTALLELSSLFKTMFEIHGSLFNTYTSEHVDNASSSARVIYDLSSLVQRGIEIAMAQFVNVLGFATNALQDGDVVVIHGADLLDEGVKAYTQRCLDDLYVKKVRVVYIYDSVDKMLENTDLNKMARADWIVTGFMSTPAVSRYQQLLGVTIPETLTNAVTNKNHMQYYLRRGFDNIIFDCDLILE